VVQHASLASHRSQNSYFGPIAGFKQPCEPGSHTAPSEGMEKLATWQCIDVAVDVIMRDGFVWYCMVTLVAACAGCGVSGLRLLSPDCTAIDCMIARHRSQRCKDGQFVLRRPSICFALSDSLF